MKPISDFFGLAFILYMWNSITNWIYKINLNDINKHLVHSRLLLYILLTQLTRFAQRIERDVLANSSGQASIGSININWTLGEAFVATRMQTTLILTEGFHQKEDVSTISPTIELTGDRSTIVTISPNPSEGLLYITLDKTPDLLLQATVSDLLGRTLHRIRLSAKQTIIDIHNLPSGIYVVSILDGKNPPRGATIVKK